MGIKQPARRRAKAKQNSIVIFTVGHSTRPIEEFEDLLLAHGVKQLVVIRNDVPILGWNCHTVLMVRDPRPWFRLQVEFPGWQVVRISARITPTTSD